MEARRTALRFGAKRVGLDDVAPLPLAAHVVLDPQAEPAFHRRFEAPLEVGTRGLRAIEGDVSALQHGRGVRKAERAAQREQIGAGTRLWGPIMTPRSSAA